MSELTAYYDICGVFQLFLCFVLVWFVFIVCLFVCFAYAIYILIFSNSYIFGGWWIGATWKTRQPSVAYMNEMNIISESSHFREVVLKCVRFDSQFFVCCFATFNTLAAHFQTATSSIFSLLFIHDNEKICYTVSKLA